MAPVDEALSFAQGLAAAGDRALGGTALGVILHGSLTLDAFVPGVSDVDLLVVVDEPLTDERWAALAEAAAAERMRAPGRVDLRLVRHRVVAAPTPLPPLEAYIEISPELDPGLHVEGPHPGERDLVVEFSFCRAHGRSLFGPAPSDLIGDVPDEWVLDVGDAQLADWEAIGDDPQHAQLTALTACRVWRFAEERRHCSKAEAGRWALGRDPTLQAVRDGLRQRQVDPATPIDAAEVARLLGIVRARLAELRRSESGHG